MIYKFNNGGIVKLQNAGSIPQSQNNIMKLWHKAYDSKLGEAVRNFMFGKDYNLSNEEYIQKHGFVRPNELAMPWFTQVSGPGIIMNLNKLGKVNITLEPEKYWYVAHQTASKNLPSIMKDGLKTGSGLSGTAIPLSEDFLKSFTEGTLKQQHLLHKGSDALVVAKFPKSKFPSGDLDDISIRLMDLGESNNFEVPVQYLKGFIKDQFKQGGILKAQDGMFEDFWNTLPQNQQDSTDFNVRRYWELNGKPINFKEAVKRGMYKKEKDGYHANSIAFNEETGEYEFMKSPNHPTIKYELDWFNSNDAKKFRDKYQLDSTSIPWKYVPKEKQGGILKAQRGTGLAGLPSIKIPENFKQKLSDWLKYKTIKYDANEPVAYIGLDGLPSGVKSNTSGELRIPRQINSEKRDWRPKVLDFAITRGQNGNYAKFIENGGKTT